MPRPNFAFRDFCIHELSQNVFQSEYKEDQFDVCPPGSCLCKIKTETAVNIAAPRTPCKQQRGDNVACHVLFIRKNVYFLRRRCPPDGTEEQNTNKTTAGVCAGFKESQTIPNQFITKRS